MRRQTKYDLIAERLSERIGEEVIRRDHAMQLLEIKSRSTMMIWEREGLLDRLIDPLLPHGVFYRRRQVEKLANSQPSAGHIPIGSTPTVIVRLKHEGKTYELTLFELIESWKQQQKEHRNA